MGCFSYPTGGVIFHRPNTACQVDEGLVILDRRGSSRETSVYKKHRLVEIVFVSSYKSFLINKYTKGTKYKHFSKTNYFPQNQVITLKRGLSLSDYGCIIMQSLITQSQFLQRRKFKYNMKMYNV